MHICWHFFISCILKTWNIKEISTAVDCNLQSKTTFTDMKIDSFAITVNLDHNEVRIGGLETSHTF